jgi:hypothetical protein
VNLSYSGAAGVRWVFNSGVIAKINAGIIIFHFFMRTNAITGIIVLVGHFNIRSNLIGHPRNAR